MMVTRLLKSLKYLLLCGLCVACTTEENFPDMGTKFNGVVSIKNISIGGQNYMLALSSDYDRSYNKGSIQVLQANDGSAEPEKLMMLELPRLGRTIDTYDKYALVTYDAEDRNSFGTVELYRFDSTTTSSLVKSWTLDCSPTNAVFSGTGNYLAISCFGGTMYAGVMSETDESSIVINKVRDYNMNLRAMHFYKSGNSEVLFAFPAIYQYPVSYTHLTLPTICSV